MQLTRGSNATFLPSNAVDSSHGMEESLHGHRWPPNINWGEIHVGAWDASAFGNDDAADFLFAFDDAHTVAQVVPILEDALDTVLEATDEIESADGSVGVAAAALVVAWSSPKMLGNAILAPWPRTAKALPEHLVAKASRVLGRMLEPQGNELAELWEEAESFSEFESEISRWRSPLV